MMSLLFLSYLSGAAGISVYRCTKDFAENRVKSVKINLL